MTFQNIIRPIALASAILLPAAGAMAATKPAPAIAGVWSGKAAQVGRSGGYAVKLTFTGKTITSDYADLGCAGTLAKAGANGNYSFYVEKITTGGIDATTNKGCVDGSVTLIKSGDSLIWGWLGAVNGKPIVVYAALTQEAGTAPAPEAEKKAAPVKKKVAKKKPPAEPTAEPAADTAAPAAAEPAAESPAVVDPFAQPGGQQPVAPQ